MVECSHGSSILLMSTLWLCGSMTSDLSRVALDVWIIIILTKITHFQCFRY